MAEAGAELAAERILAKWVLPLAVSAAMLFGGVVGNQVLQSQSKLEAAVLEMSKSLAQVKTELAVMKANLEFLKQANHIPGQLP